MPKLLRNNADRNGSAAHMVRLLI